jgi:protein TonB
VRISLRGFGRRRTVASVAGSVAVHALVLAALVWVKAPSTDVTVKRGEPLFVELPEANEQAQRGLAAARQPERPRAPAAPEPAPPAAKPAPPTPPMVAQAAPEPKQATLTPTAPAPPEVPDLAVPPPATQAPKPAEVSTETPGQGPEAAAPKVAAVPTPQERVPDIRSALRPGGGAGGLGFGQRGIYGDPVPLETNDPKYVDYFTRIRRMIQAKWFYPCPEGYPAAPDCARREGQLLADLGIAKDGHLTYLILISSSGSLNMDEFALTAVKLAAPFPPVPDSVGKNGVGILGTFRYVVVGDTSLTNLLR